VLLLLAIIYFLAACLLMMLANWIGLIPLKRAKNAHWTARSRLLWPVRFTANINVFVIAFLLNQLHWYLFPDSYSSSNWLLDGFAAVLGAILGCYPLDRQIFPELNFKNWWRQTLATWGMRVGIWVVLVAGMLLMPETLGVKMVLIICGYLLIHFLLTWGFLLKYFRLIGFLKPAGQRLQRIVDATSSKIGNVNVRATWEMGGRVANAFAFPVTHELVFCERTLEICSDDEVAAICAHEIAHLKESRFVLITRLLGSLTIFPLLFINPAVHWIGPLGFLLPYIFVLVMLRFTKWFSQKMERRADALAAKEQNDEGVYARALEKLYRENLSPAVNVNNRQTHPHLYDRMVAAGITPDFPRPDRPKRFTIIGWVFIFASAAFIVFDIMYT
jgi:Zn-dependent protease with chaperone function